MSLGKQVRDVTKKEKEKKIPLKQKVYDMTISRTVTLEQNLTSYLFDYLRRKVIITKKIVSGNSYFWYLAPRQYVTNKANGLRRWGDCLYHVMTIFTERTNSCI